MTILRERQQRFEHQLRLATSRRRSTSRQAHGDRDARGMKYYAVRLRAQPGAGLRPHERELQRHRRRHRGWPIEDAANDPTLHCVSNSWGYGGDAEWGASDPFVITTGNSLALAAAAGTTFYFSTGDAARSSRAIRQTARTSSPSAARALLHQQHGHAQHRGHVGGRRQLVLERHRAPGVADRTGRDARTHRAQGAACPDVSAIADTNSSVRFVSSTNATGGTAERQASAARASRRLR